MSCYGCGGYSQPGRYAVQWARSDDGRWHSAPRAVYRSRNSTHPLQSASEKSHRAPCETNFPGPERHTLGSPCSAEPGVCLPQSSSSLSDALLIALNCQSFVDFPGNRYTIARSFVASLSRGPLPRRCFSGPFSTGSTLSIQFLLL
jgi:hypothetical protein